jgi:hypothetical protein
MFQVNERIRLLSVGVCAWSLCIFAENTFHGNYVSNYFQRHSLHGFGG